MNPSDAGIYDRVIIQDIIKEIASSAVLSSKNDFNFKVVILNEVDHLTKDAQHGLRRTMEKYMANCRIILLCESVSKVIDPLRSRCLAIRIAAPSHDEIVSALNYVANQERVNLTPGFVNNTLLFFLLLLLYFSGYFAKHLSLRKVIFFICLLKKIKNEKKKKK